MVAHTVKSLDWGRLQSDGYIYCDDLQPHKDGLEIRTHFWCEVLEAQINFGHDSDLLFNDDSAFYLKVPMFPTDFNLWTEVSCVRTADDLLRINIGDVVSTNSKFLCWLHPGEGIKVIRQILLEHMLGTERPDSCTSNSHGMREMQLWQQHMQASHFQMMEYWCLKEYKMCHACTEQLHDAVNMVPEKEGSRTW